VPAVLVISRRFTSAQVHSAGVLSIDCIGRTGSAVRIGKNRNLSQKKTTFLTKIAADLAVKYPPFEFKKLFSKNTLFICTDTAIIIGLKSKGGANKFCI
jgi:hypothetical protein